MTYLQAQNECDRRNAARDVAIHAHGSIDARTYLSTCRTDHNFTICGGTGEQRQQMLLDLLADHCRKSSVPVILLTSSDSMIGAVIHSARNNLLGQVRVFSPQYRAYDPLYQMDPIIISELLMSVARSRGYGNLSQLERYVNTFIEISGKSYPPSLEALISLGRQADTAQKLIGIGRYHRMPESQLTSIDSYPAGAADLNSILLAVSHAFSNIYTPGKPTQASLVSLCGGFKRNPRTADRVICLKINSQNPALLDLALSMELRQLMSSGTAFRLVVHDVPMVHPEGLCQQMANAKSTYGSTSLGICVQNPVAWTRPISAGGLADSLLQNTQIFVLFRNPGDTDSDLEALLQYLGTYMKYEVRLGPDHKFHMFPRLTSNAWEVSQVGKYNRVAPEDLTGQSVVLSGHDNRRIHLYNRIQFLPGKVRYHGF